MHKDVQILLDTLHISYNNLDLYNLAFTHSSFNIDAKTIHQDYERLEYVGDSVVNFVVAELAFRLRQDLSQGDLSKLRAAIVQSKALAKKAKELHFDEYIKLGHSLPDNMKESKRILEDVFEAFIGAIYLDKGADFVINYVETLFANDIKNFKVEIIQDYKSELQEEMQAEYRDSVKYTLIKEVGPAHDRTFEVEVSYNNTILGHGSGKTKKEAEQMAALDALRKKAI